MTVAPLGVKVKVQSWDLDWGQICCIICQLIGAYLPPHTSNANLFAYVAAFSCAIILAFNFAIHFELVLITVTIDFGLHDVGIFALYSSLVTSQPLWGVYILWNSWEYSLVSYSRCYCYWLNSTCWTCIALHFPLYTYVSSLNYCILRIVMIMNDNDDNKSC